MVRTEWQADVHVGTHLPQDSGTFDLCTPGQRCLHVGYENLDFVLVNPAKTPAVCLRGAQCRGRKGGAEGEGAREVQREYKEVRDGGQYLTSRTSENLIGSQSFIHFIRAE